MGGTMDLIYNLKDMQDMLINIYTLTNFRVAIFNKNFQETLAYPTRLSSFCRELRSQPVLNEKCKLCDLKAFQKCQSTNEIVIYDCHAGFTEAIAPIKSSSLIIGYLMFGQVLSSTTPNNTWEKMYSYLKDYKINFEQLMALYQKRQIVPCNFIESAAQILGVCANYLYQTQKVKLNSDTMAYQIDKYILEHLTEPLDIQTLCEHFHCRKTNFYKITNAIFGVGIAKHIRQMRIQRSKELLLNTDLSISEIALAVGIEDYNYFSKIFKQESKCTPTEFRKNNFQLIK